MKTTEASQSNFLNHVDRILEASGNVVGHVFAMHNISPARARGLGRLVTAGIVTLGIAAYATDRGIEASNSTTPTHYELVYPNLSQHQVEASRDTVMVEGDSEGVDSVIARANKGLLVSTAPGSDKITRELEKYVRQETPGGDGIINPNHHYEVPVIQEVPRKVS